MFKLGPKTFFRTACKHLLSSSMSIACLYQYCWILHAKPETSAIQSIAFGQFERQLSSGILASRRRWTTGLPSTDGRTCQLVGSSVGPLGVGLAGQSAATDDCVATTQLRGYPSHFTSHIIRSCCSADTIFHLVSVCKSKTAICQVLSEFVLHSQRSIGLAIILAPAGRVTTPSTQQSTL